MNSLDRYILRQFSGPLLIIVIVLTTVIWMTQSLQRVDILIENGRGIGLFLYLSVLVIPSLLMILIPFALFTASLYSLFRLHSDSEVAVMFAAGISRMRIAMPILVMSFVGAGLSLYLALDLSPRTYRMLKENIVNIRTDIAGSVLHSGEFIKVIDGFTIHVNEVRSNQTFDGILIHDYRNPEQSRTYFAERGGIRQTAGGPVLILRNGNVQRRNRDIGDIDLVPFEETRINIAALRRNEDRHLELNERYLSELLNPDLSDPWVARNLGKLAAEAHSRLSAPLHAFSYVFVALFALVGGTYNRRGYGVRIVVATAIVIGLRVVSYLLETLSAETGQVWLLYALPLFVILFLVLLLFDVFPLPRVPVPEIRLRKAG